MKDFKAKFAKLSKKAKKPTKKKAAPAKQAEPVAQPPEKSSKKKEKNWYMDRYQNAVVQRNVLLLIVVLSLVGIIFSVFTVRSVTLSKSIDPFVVEIEEKTGITNVVERLKKERYSSMDAVRRYFIVKYVRARERYRFFDYEYNYYTLVRLYSSARVYNQFRRQLDINSDDSVIKQYGTEYARDIQIKSISFLPTRDVPGITVQVRFVVTGKFVKGRIAHKIATMNFDFYDFEMSIQDRFVNPLGFQVQSYEVDDEVQTK